jgi:hypothetical protein
MAQRRMFSLKVIDTDEFSDMPMSSQFLYYNLAMRADDDGFIGNPKKIMKMSGCNDDDMRVLSSKKFIIPFESGICVIRHWRIHNYIQKDRLTPTEYQDELNSLRLNNGKYEQPQERLIQEPCIQNVSKMDSQYRLGKDRLGKDSIVSNASVADNKEFQGLIDLFKSVNPTHYKLFSNKSQRAALHRLVDAWGIEEITRAINTLPALIGKQYAPVITTPIALENKYGDLMIYVEKEKGRGGKITSI